MKYSKERFLSLHLPFASYSYNIPGRPSSGITKYICLTHSLFLLSDSQLLKFLTVACFNSNLLCHHYCILMIFDLPSYTSVPYILFLSIIIFTYYNYYATCARCTLSVILTQLFFLISPHGTFVGEKTPSRTGPPKLSRNIFY